MCGLVSIIYSYYEGDFMVREVCTKAEFITDWGESTLSNLDIDFICEQGCKIELDFELLLEDYGAEFRTVE